MPLLPPGASRVDVVPKNYAGGASCQLGSVARLRWVVSRIDVGSSLRQIQSGGSLPPAGRLSIEWTLDNDLASVSGDFLWSRRGPGDRRSVDLVQWAETSQQRTLQLPLKLP